MNGFPNVPQLQKNKEGDLLIWQWAKEGRNNPEYDIKQNKLQRVSLIVKNKLTLLNHFIGHKSEYFTYIQELVQKSIPQPLSIARYSNGDEQYIQMHKAFNAMVRAIDYMVSVEEIDPLTLVKYCNSFQFEQIIMSFRVLDRMNHIQKYTITIDNEIAMIMDTFTYQMVVQVEKSRIEGNLQRVKRDTNLMQIHYQCPFEYNELIPLRTIIVSIWEAIYQDDQLENHKDKLYKLIKKELLMLRI